MGTRDVEGVGSGRRRERKKREDGKKMDPEDEPWKKIITWIPYRGTLHKRVLHKKVPEWHKYI